MVRTQEPADRTGVAPWRVEVPGQPPSVNHMYKPTIRESKEGSFRSMAKEGGVETYQTLAALLVKTTIPSAWKRYLQSDSTSQIKVTYWFHLGPDADCSNMIKALEDSIARAMGVNDSRFLPCVVGKDTGNKEPWTSVEISLA